MFPVFAFAFEPIDFRKLVGKAAARLNGMERDLRERAILLPRVDNILTSARSLQLARARCMFFHVIDRLAIRLVYRFGQL